MLSQTLISISNTATSRLDMWDRFINHIRAEKVLEVGVWKGAFASHMLKRCESVTAYYMVDPWRKLDAWNKPLNEEDGHQEETFRAAMEATQFAENKRVVLRGVTTEVIDRIPDESLDFVYIDGDHTLRGIATDLISVYPKVKPGGYLVGDDFEPSIWQHDTKFEPSLVFPFSVYFAEAVRMPFFALPLYQFLIAKLPQQEHAHAFTDFTGKYQYHGLLEHVTLKTIAKRRAEDLVRSSLKSLLRGREG
jgi:hypothetical protein